jgi:hypothetical protein
VTAAAGGRGDEGPDITADLVIAEARRRFAEVGAYELGGVYQEMLSMRDRLADGVLYTPPEVAQAMARMALEQGIAQVGPEPDDLLRVVCCDPACGAGVFLIEGPRLLVHAYAARLAGGDPSPSLIHAVTPTVILWSVFGLDIDPVAVDLARTALSWETGGILPRTALDRHIVWGNPLEGDTPPAMDERIAQTRTH